MSDDRQKPDGPLDRAIIYGLLILLTVLIIIWAAGGGNK